MAIEIDLKGMVALVTGAGRGIGRAVALSLARAGADVCLTARSVRQLEATADRVRAEGRSALVLPADATNAAAVAGVVDGCVEKMGGLQVLVNNAGTRLLKPLVDMSEEEYDRLMDTNLKSMFLFSRSAGKHFIAQRYGRVVNMASVSAFVSGSNQAIYNAGKAAIAHFTKAMAIEWARHDIRVNAVAPGWIRTDMIKDLRENDEKLSHYLKALPQRRLGEPEEVAPMVAFLCSDLSAYMTGSVIVIDGGLMIP